MFRKRKSGQTVVELLFVLPIFFCVLFFIMELANIAFNSLISHHAAYELARAGALVAVTKQGGPTNKTRVTQKLRKFATQLSKGKRRKMQYKVSYEATGKDPETKEPNEDLIVTVIYPVTLVFPGTNWIFADQPKRLGIKRIYASARMPIERPSMN